MGGNLIGSHIVPMGTGVDYMGNMIKAAVGDATDWNPVSSPVAVATKLLALHPGVVKELPDFLSLEKMNNVNIEHHLHIGDEITPYRTNLDGCGYVVASKVNVAASIEHAESIRKIIDETIVRIS